MSGLVVKGQVRTKGEVIDMPNGLPESPEDQMAKWHGKVYYVVIDSNLDTAKAKEILGKQEEDLVKIKQVEIGPQLSEEGQILLGNTESKELTLDDLPNVVPDYFEAEDEMEEMDLDKGHIADIEEEEEEEEEEEAEEEEAEEEEDDEEDEEEEEAVVAVEKNKKTGKKKTKVTSSKKKLTSKKDK